MRAGFLVATVALVTGSLLASGLLLLGLRAGLNRGLARLGADLMVVSRGALANPVPSLLTGEAGQPPLPAGTAARLEALPGVARAAPQRVLRFANPELCGPAQAELVAFDPARDFTVLSWVEDHLERPFGPGDVVVGSRLPYQPGDSFMQFTVWGRLGSSGVGTHERGLFVPWEAVPREVLAAGQPALEQPSAVLLRVSPGFSVEGLRFALGADPQLRVLEASHSVTEVRQTLVFLLTGMVGLTSLMLGLTVVMIGLLFSAVVNERQRELGLLAALGLSPARLVALVASETAAATGVGGLLGGAVALGLVRLSEHALVGVGFEWPAREVVLLTGLGGLLLSTVVGALGGAVPALALARRTPQELIRREC